MQGSQSTVSCEHVCPRDNCNFVREPRVGKRCAIYVLRSPPHLGLFPRTDAQLVVRYGTTVRQPEDLEGGREGTGGTPECCPYCHMPSPTPQARNCRVLLRCNALSEAHHAVV